tara:strand:+ start:68 stop:1015 length:948 start_codon:yes stop_codon:yes gene_type:complete
MAEKHSAVSIPAATWGAYLRAIWNFVENTQSGILQFVQEGGNYAVKTGGAFWNGSDDLSSSGFGSDNDYIVIEPVNSYPGGDKWQVQIKALDVDDDEVAEATIEVSYLGGYDTGDEDFGSNQTSGTKAASAFNYQKFTTSDDWYISCSNSDTYVNNAGTQTYTYFRMLQKNDSSSDDGKFEGWYVGGYIPVEPNSDTKPIVLLGGIVRMSTSAYFWGGTNCGECPGNFAHSAAGGTNNAVVNTLYDAYTGYGVTRSGTWANGPVLILDDEDNCTLGVLGKYTALAGDLDRTSGATDSSAEYIVTNDIMSRWKPSA